MRLLLLVNGCLHLSNSAKCDLIIGSRAKQWVYASVEIEIIPDITSSVYLSFAIYAPASAVPVPLWETDSNSSDL